VTARLLFLFSILAALPVATPLHATTYWVAPPPAGNDSNSGLSSNTPFATPQKAVAATLAPGDTIYIRGGTYILNAKVAPGSSKVGAAGNPIKFWAYPGEQPIFDFDTMPESSDKALDMRRNYWHVRGITVMNAPDSGIFVGGTGVIIEGCVVHDCDNDGFALGSTSVSATNALILNCDSYRNFQVSSGGNNGDGFAAKTGCGPGNVFRGCRSWNNADDGWDFFNNTNNSVVLQDCWSFKNGYDVWGVGASFSGNGNGFKLGGAGTQAKHYLTNCLAFSNRSKGFDHNHSGAGQTIINCTGYSNSVNFSFYETPTAGSPLPNLLINDVAFTGTPFNLDPTTVQITNSWQGFTVTAADFASIDTSQATNARNADFSLPDLPMLHLAAGSDLIDRAANVGLPYTGSAPDLGAYEFIPAAPPRIITLVAPQWSGSGFAIQVNGLTGHGSVIVHASTDLTVWSPIFTNQPVTGSLPFLDPSATNQPKRFYRAEEK
jgi:Pel9A-like, right handed beta helix region